MSATTPIVPTVPVASRERVAPLLPMLLMQTRAELLRLVRNPAFAVISLAFPIVFFVFFGLPNVGKHIYGVDAGVFQLASFAAYGAINVALFSFGVGIAAERGQRTNVLMRATPLRPTVYLAAKVVAALAFSAVMLAALFAFGMIVGKIPLSASTFVNLIFRMELGLLPFVALGFAIGNLAPPSAAAPIVNIIYLPLSFASGLFTPREFLPPVVQTIAPYTPTYRFAQLAWSAIGANTGSSVGASVLWLVGYGAVFVALAIWAYSREQSRTFA